MIVIGQGQPGKAPVAAKEESKGGPAEATPKPEAKPEPIRAGEEVGKPKQEAEGNQPRQPAPRPEPQVPAVPQGEVQPPRAKPRAAEPPRDLDAKQLVAAVEPAVVRIDVTKRDGDDGHGSGFVVGD